MKIKIEVSEEIRDTKFKGIAIFGDRPFAFSVTFVVPVSRLDSEMEARNHSADEIPDIIRIDVEGPDKKPMTLTKEEYVLLFYLSADLCAILHDNKQAQAATDLNNSLAAQLRMLDPGYQITAALTRTVDVPDENIPERFRSAA